MNGVGKAKINLFWLKTRFTDARYFVITVWLYIQETHASLYVKSARLIGVLCLIGVGKGQLTFFFCQRQGFTDACIYDRELFRVGVDRQSCMHDICVIPT